MAKFWIKQFFQNPRICARICLGRVLNIFSVLDMPGFWIWKDSEYARITQGSKYMAQYVWTGCEYAWNVLIFNNRQGSEYVSCNT